MTTAFVLSGGANLGAVQVGMLRALYEHGIRPELLVGASAGAINAAWLASAGDDGDMDGLADVWRGLRRRDVFPLNLLRGLSGFLGRSVSLFDNAALRRVLSQHVGHDGIEQTRLPLEIVVTDVLSGRDVALSEGVLVDALVASSAIPGVFPPVRVGERLYMDGGVANNAPISHAIDSGATTVYVLPTGYSCSLSEAPTSALGMTLHALSLMVNRRLSLEVDRYLAEDFDLRVVPPPCPLDVGPGDFDHADELIRRGYESTIAWLPTAGSTPDNPIGLHNAAHHP